jgi:hypothetical protein
MNKHSKAMRKAWETRRRNAAKKTAPTKRTVPTLTVAETFELRDGLPGTRRFTMDHALYVKLKNTISQLEPLKKHMVIDKGLKNRALGVAQREFPKIKLRTATNPDKRTVSIWRQS